MYGKKVGMISVTVMHSFTVLSSEELLRSIILRSFSYLSLTDVTAIHLKKKYVTEMEISEIFPTKADYLAI